MADKAALEAAREIWETPPQSAREADNLNVMAEIISRHYAPRLEAAEKMAEALNKGWMVWSGDHGTWWGPNRSGYTRVVADAGRYSLAEAWKIMQARDFRCGSKLGKLREGEPGVYADFVVPSPELVAALKAWESTL